MMWLFGMATMKELGLDLYPWALEKLRPRAVPVQTGVESPSFLAARRVISAIHQHRESQVARAETCSRQGGVHCHEGAKDPTGQATVLLRCFRRNGS